MSFNKAESLKITTKKRIGILERLKKPDTSYEQLHKYLEYADDPLLAKPILKTLFAHLVLEDTVISAAYCFTDEDEWQLVNGDSSSDEEPHPSQDLQQKIGAFTRNFFQILEILKKQNFGVVKEVLAPLYLNRTKNVQFVLFELCKTMQAPVFGYIFENLKKTPLLYAPFYVSLLVRFSFSPDFRRKCFEVYFRFVSSRSLSARVDSVLLSQGILYILCFNPEFFEFPGVSNFVDRAISAGHLRLANQKIVGRFCALFDREPPAKSAPLNNSCLCLFPFDKPIIKKIENFIKINFVNFSAHNG